MRRGSGSFECRLGRAQSAVDSSECDPRGHDPDAGARAARRRLDENGRSAFLTTREGRTSTGTIRHIHYKVTRPCWIGEPCPHEKDPDTCEWTYYSEASKCPSSRSPHDVRKARVTKYRNDGVHRGIVSDELDASEQVLDKHYDRATERERADRRWRQINR